MEGILPFLLVAAIVLACPVTMGAMGVGVWLWARAKGEKKDFSMGCMGGGQCDHKEHAGQDQQRTGAEPARLQEEVVRLDREITSLRAQIGASQSDGAREGNSPTDRITA
ncbi:MAG TPA: hypothetical protein VMR52_04365 [Dehalococcoidia bacterium]|nr:hypothetical protein [Dehalococcoidia bacterium]